MMVKTIICDFCGRTITGDVYAHNAYMLGRRDACVQCDHMLRTMYEKAARNYLDGMAKKK